MAISYSFWEDAKKRLYTDAMIINEVNKMLYSSSDPS